ncbi:MAG TPA: fibronectin type III domain-containing protein [Candidatus Bathyarchaeia archaeon]
MGLSKSLALMFLLFFIASLVALPQKVRALPEPTPNLNPALALNVKEVTDTTVTLSWTSDQPPAGFVLVSGVPYFNNYILRMSNKTLDSQHPYSRSNYEDVWTTLDSKQTTTTVTNLSSSTKYNFYILAADYFGGEFSNIVEVQTLPSPTSSPTPTPTASTSTPTPSIPELSWLMVAPLILSLFSVAVIVRHRKTISQNKPNV